MIPKFIVENENKKAEIFSHNGHYTIEMYKDSIWQVVRTTTNEQEAKRLAEEYVGGSKPTLLNE